MNQAMIVLNHLVKNGTITPLKARHVYRIESLSSRISWLRKHGYRIQGTWHLDESGKRYREYRLITKRAA